MRATRPVHDGDRPAETVAKMPPRSREVWVGLTDLELGAATTTLVLNYYPGIPSY